MGVPSAAVQGGVARGVSGQGGGRWSPSLGLCITESHGAPLSGGATVTIHASLLGSSDDAEETQMCFGLKAQQSPRIRGLRRSWEHHCPPPQPPGAEAGGKLAACLIIPLTISPVLPALSLCL